MSRAVRAGDRFLDAYGQELVVVDRAQKNQSVGYWVQGNTLQYVMDTVNRGRFGVDYGWVMSDASRDVLSRKGNISLCFVRELDPPEENEFGLVSP